MPQQFWFRWGFGTYPKIRILRVLQTFPQYRNGTSENTVSRTLHIKRVSQQERRQRHLLPIPLLPSSSSKQRQNKNPRNLRSKASTEEHDRFQARAINITEGPVWIRHWASSSSDRGRLAFSNVIEPTLRERHSARYIRTTALKRSRRAPSGLFFASGK